MNDEKLSLEEKELLKQYQTLSSSIPSLVSRLAVEVVPPIIFMVVWFFSGQVLYLIVLIGLMVFYNVQRVLRQYKNIVKLNSISKKTIGIVQENENA